MGDTDKETDSQIRQLKINFKLIQQNNEAESIQQQPTTHYEYTEDAAQLAQTEPGQELELQNQKE